MTGAFYDDLSGTYDLMFPDWDASMARQASQLAEFIPADARVLDCACGIGTQAIGLALRGLEVVGTDLSPKAASRAVAEASARGVALPAFAADMRSLPFADGSFDVVLAADNALPHLLTAQDVLAALREMRRVLRPGGRLLLSTRDYDSIRDERPSSTPPSVGPGRVVWFQLWHWDGDQYELEMFQLHEAESWHVVVGKARYWAIARHEITALAERAGFGYVEWLLHAYCQPLFVAANG
ncbi:class I SAM-dependent methyltransferase [Lentzea californiensis]|uniref:class I SAM-dependent methyltransferase n=1 Tax=Lentzea californiensis TaxID=438851 RepID=UPI002164DB60|nr:class I SAM-dependent methyltransferase [Lentzea californiensis]MCR3748483.1 Methyltransferase domain-containing protein [Lentzea californiensis]